MITFNSYSSSPHCLLGTSTCLLVVSMRMLVACICSIVVSMCIRSYLSTHTIFCSQLWLQQAVTNEAVLHQSLWITHIKTCCYTANNRCRTHTAATACCSLEYSSSKYSFEMFAKVLLYSYIHKRKGHKMLKKRRKGSRQPRKKEEIPLSLNSVCPAFISFILLSSLTFCYLWGVQGVGAIRFAFEV